VPVTPVHAEALQANLVLGHFRRGLE
jgi:hypothetical protein